MGRRYFGQHSRNERTFVLIDKLEVKKVLQLNRQLQSICGSFCKVEGELKAFSIYTENLIHILSTGALWSLVGVMVVLYGILVYFRLQERMLFLFSAVWGPVILLGLISLLQFPINIMTAIIGAIAIGLAGDNGIQFLFAAKKRTPLEGVHYLSPAACICCVTMSLTSLSFLASDIPVIRHIGFLLPCLFILGFCGDVFVFRSACPIKKLSG